MSRIEPPPQKVMAPAPAPSVVETKIIKSDLQIAH